MINSKRPLFSWKSSEEKNRIFRLITCAFCRSVATDPEYLQAVAAVEAVAEGKEKEENLSRFTTLKWFYYDGFWRENWDRHPPNLLASSMAGAAMETARFLITLRAARPRQKKLIEKQLANIVREITGNDPFNPIIVKPEWQTRTVTSLVQNIYETRDFTIEPILADALEDAGCDNEEILRHLRSEQKHYLGCWAIDALKRRDK